MEEPFVARLPIGEDLLEAITKVFQERSIRKATFNVIGTGFERMKLVKRLSVVEL